jgi:hypothetical protein
MDLKTASVRQPRGYRGRLASNHPSPVGQRFNRFTVLRVSATAKEYKGRNLHYDCQCDCGAVKVVRIDSLRQGHVKSCGCLQRDMHITHGHSEDTEYNTWHSMKSRCLRKTDPNYHHYGGRGIIICDRWKDSFENFFADMGFKPTPKHSIDRIDVDGNYEPSNCRWATAKEQANNTRRNKRKKISGCEGHPSERKA